MSEWISVEDRLPEGTVLAFYLNSHGKGRRVRAAYVKAFTVISNPDDDEYDCNANGETFVPEGWYEEVDNNHDFSSLFIFNGEVTHWMPLPEPPK